MSANGSRVMNTPNMIIKKLLYSLLVVPFVEIADRIVKKDDRLWAFSMHHLNDGKFVENSRAVFEKVKDDPEIQPVIFTRECDRIENLENPGRALVVKIKSLKGLMLFIRCRVIFVTHSISMDYSLRWFGGKFTVVKINLNRHIVVNLWHGIPVKRLLALTNPAVRQKTDRVKYRRKEKTCYAGLIASSDIDSYAMAAMFQPIRYDQIWVTGLPRTDFLLMDENELPDYLWEENRIVRELKNKKKLVVFVPTYRQTSVVDDAVYYQFSDYEIECLKRVLRENGAILGVRLHYFNNSSKIFNIGKYIDDDVIFDLGQNIIREISPIIRNADLVISDYSSVFIDALVLGKPVIGFIYDYSNYTEKQDGLLYDYGIVFPGPLANCFEELLTAIESELKGSTQALGEKYAVDQSIFFKYSDKNNSARVVAKVKNLLLSRA